MKKKTKQDFIKWIEEQINYYKPFLGLELYRISIKENEAQYLGMTFRYPYVEPELQFSNKAFENFKNGEFEKDMILHELVHVITDPFYAKAISRCVSKEEIEDEREKLTDNLMVIIRNLIEKEIKKT